MGTPGLGSLTGKFRSRAISQQIITGLGSPRILGRGTINLAHQEALLHSKIALPQPLHLVSLFALCLVEGFWRQILLQLDAEPIPTTMRGA